MILDSEDQRNILLEALLNVQISGTYETMARMWPIVEATVAAVREATIAGQGEESKPRLETVK